MYQLVIIIGLPGSGKTEYSKKFITEYDIYDDFLSTMYTSEVNEMLRSGNHLCLNDPRLTYFPSFERFISRIDNVKMKLILFENDPDQCIVNSNERVPYKDVNKQITTYSEYYDLEKYKKYNHEVVPVYRPGVSSLL